MKEEHPNSDNSQKNNYYYGAAPYGYDYTAGGYEGGAPTPQHSIKDYLVIFREKIWYFILALLVVFASSIIYCFKATPIFKSAAVVHVLRDDQSYLGVKSLESNDIQSVQDLNTQIKVMESSKIVSNVAERLKGKDLKKFMQPYEGKSELLGPITTQGILAANRKIIPMRASLMVAISYSHPDPQVAAMIANMFANEYISYNIKLDVENSMKAVDGLKAKVDQQRMKVESIEAKMAEYRERHGTISLDKQADIDHQELASINNSATDYRKTLDQIKEQYDQVQAHVKAGGDLTRLPFIAEEGRVKALTMDLSNKKIERSALSKRYRAKHPTMVILDKGIEETRRELTVAINETVQKLNNTYALAQDNFRQSSERLKGKETKIISLGKLRVEYNSLVRELEVNHHLYEQMMTRLNVELAQINLKKPNARIIDKALPPVDPSSPRIALIVPAGLFGGMIVGVALVFLVVQLDDRTKSAFDVEKVIGIPLIGVIPRIKLSNSKEKSHCVIDGSNSMILEAFRTIHASLRVSSKSKDAKVLITVSTAPSEGKTFFTANLAATFAQHNEKTLLIDADLRMPSIGYLFDYTESKGVQQYCNDTATFDEVITHDTNSGLDIIVAGGKSSNPSAMLTSERFAQLISEARSRYDRIVIDTAPLGAVSDVFNILPLADGIAYVIKFNTINRSSVKKHVNRISESDVPVLGAVMNQVSMTMTQYYYSSYYNKAYTKYYTSGKPEAVNSKALGSKKNKDKELVKT